MGYDIYIGNAVPKVYEDEFAWTVEPITIEDAPAFLNDYTKHENGRSPSYTSWVDFVKETGLNDLFFEECEGLMRMHPGIAPLKPEHLIDIKAAVSKWRLKHPEAVPQFTSSDDYRAMPTEAQIADAQLARLLWLEWWVDWALTNAEHPAIKNS